MKALTVYEPWASFIAAGLKRYETRSFKTNYRGLIAIHAAKRWEKDQDAALRRLAAVHPQLREYLSYEWPLGCVIAACRLVAVYPTEKLHKNLRDNHPLEYALGDYSPDRFAWELQVLKLPPKPIKATGQQGIWEWNYTGG